MNKTLGLGFTLGLTILAYGLFGKLIDKIFKIDGLFTIIGFIVGTIVAFAYMLYELNKHDRN